MAKKQTLAQLVDYWIDETKAVKAKVAILERHQQAHAQGATIGQEKCVRLPVDRQAPQRRESMNLIGELRQAMMHKANEDGYCSEGVALACLPVMERWINIQASPRSGDDSIRSEIRYEFGMQLVEKLAALANKPSVPAGKGEDREDEDS